MAVNTKYVVRLPGGLELHVECKDRPVDFDIVFKDSGTVSFHREQGPDKQGKVDVVGSGLTRDEIPGSAPNLKWWRTQPRNSRVAAMSAGVADQPFIEFSDPGM